MLGRLKPAETSVGSLRRRFLITSARPLSVTVAVRACEAEPQRCCQGSPGPSLSATRRRGGRGGANIARHEGQLEAPLLDPLADVSELRILLAKIVA